jgi:hypothetical protein
MLRIAFVERANYQSHWHPMIIIIIIIINTNEIDVPFSADSADATSIAATTTTATCHYDIGGIQTIINNTTSAYDDNNKANTAHSIHRTDKIKWFDISNNNNKPISNSTTGNLTSTTSTFSSNNKYNDNETFHLSFIFKLISLIYLILIKASSPKEFKTAPKEKHHPQQQQQQQHYHGKHR